MKWYHYLFCFLGGAFIANFVPHFVNGISGEMFPTPFADPPGRGLSAAFVNVLWALGNLVAGYLFLWGAKFSLANRTAPILAFIGFAAMALNLSLVFAGVPR